MIWAHGLGVQAVLSLGKEGGARGQGSWVRCVYSKEEERRMLTHPHLLFFLQSGTLVHRGVPPVPPQLSVSENNLSDKPRSLSLRRF